MATTEIVFASNGNQATASTNDCGNGQMPTIGRQNIGSRIKGHGNSVALAAQQTFPEPPSETATVIVIKNVQWAIGQQCPGLPAPSAFTMFVFQPPPLPAVEFAGSAGGTPVTIQPGDYDTGYHAIKYERSSKSKRSKRSNLG